jgi:predicted nucleotidyltransferase
MLSQMDGAAVETQLRDYFSKQPRGIVATYLFGSFGRGTAGPGSDVDVAVLYGDLLEFARLIRGRLPAV